VLHHWPSSTSTGLTEGLRSEGLRSEGLRPEGLRPEGLRSEGLRSEGLRSEGLRSGRRTIERVGFETKGLNPNSFPVTCIFELCYIVNRVSVLLSCQCVCAQMFTPMKLWCLSTTCVLIMQIHIYTCVCTSLNVLTRLLQASCVASYSLYLYKDTTSTSRSVCCLLWINPHAHNVTRLLPFRAQGVCVYIFMYIHIYFRAQGVCVYIYIYIHPSIINTTSSSLGSRVIYIYIHIYLYIFI